MKITRIVGFGTLWALTGIAILRAQQSADLAADVQQKITALERVVLQEPQPGAPTAPASPTPPGMTNNAPAPVAPAPPAFHVSPAVRYVWSGLQQVLTTYGQFANNFFNQQSWLQEDLTGLHAFLIGEKLEAAGQTLDAIRSYRQSLATLGKFFPADPPAARLKALAAKFPDLYQQALQQPIAKTP